MTERIRIASQALTAEIDPLGAELQSLCDDQGRELIWSGDPAIWAGRAPILFPIVGRLRGDRYRYGDQSFVMAKHGFARRSAFDVVTSGPAHVGLRLVDHPETRLSYPFAFALDIDFALTGGSLLMTARIRNTGSVALPASFGFHPAFAWPLPYGGDRGDHALSFARDEPARLQRVTPDGLIGTGDRDTPVRGRVLTLDDSLFTDDALVWTELASQSLTYGAPGRPRLHIEFPDTPYLGVWTKPGAGFVCIEPWAGIADDEHFAGDFTQKRGVFIVEPSAEKIFTMRVTLTG